MTEKVYITSKQMATFVCPQCQKSKTVNVSQYTNHDKIVRVNVKCPCGYAYSAILEKRKKYRKETYLSGTYEHFVGGKKVDGGLMTVKDISTTGMKLKMSIHHRCAVGDLIRVEFQLDDIHNTLITKKVIVRNIKGPEIGTEFAPTEAVDKALGFYLFS